ncbi:MAG: lysophospholipid acyltransferase family protein [Acidobacteria bacterium]|nr:lysophospholipid acyltransferase family protein [Acidobacteriota bacterium]
MERLKIYLVSLLGYWIIRIVCATLRWEVQEARNLDSIRREGKRLIIAFWHGRMFMCSYFFRNQGIVVMTSRNRDGEYMARVIERFGYGLARGSSTRGSHGATVECLRAMKSGRDLGLAADGPRGPRYVAKPGAAYLARKSGNPVIPIHISVQRKWTIHSWDHFQVPFPFSRAVALTGQPIYIRPDTNEEEIRIVEERIQEALDDLRLRGDSWWDGQTGR